MSAIITNNGFMITGDHLEHSPKGSTWKKHKYLRKINGRYYYDIRDLDNATEKFKDKKSQEYNRLEQVAKEAKTRNNPQLNAGGTQSSNIIAAKNAIRLAKESEAYRFSMYKTAAATTTAYNLGLDFINKMFNTPVKVPDKKKKQHTGKTTTFRSMVPGKYSSSRTKKY